MSQDEVDTAAEAREGLFDSVAGKAKEVAGAVTGNDELVEEGQLQQAESKQRKAAVADEAIADAKRQQAADELRETNHEAAAEKQAADDRADVAQRAVDRERAEERAAAERDAAQQEAIGRQSAEQEADAVAEAGLRESEMLAADARTTEQQAAADRERLEREADIAERQAAQLRADAPTEG
ncbi:hypothetical protein [Aeromicrobium sp. NPDC092404]|uniref:hypothetical protein n=1 Tax=Aeromicrobium sp. NPDC092404 TaxID=3154976 RepID=UPI003446E476